MYIVVGLPDNCQLYVAQYVACFPVMCGLVGLFSCIQIALSPANPVCASRTKEVAFLQPQSPLTTFKGVPARVYCVCLDSSTVCGMMILRVSLVVCWSSLDQGNVGREVW